ncbi:periplasmic nitrate reductase, NapE protein [Pseudovibrio ascidiaceicola]|jgi:nitrate reductase NapE|uniref:periplasmic nitrate reductase, NapE protein n=1 Tax=Pseudovibrio ascidiaceicola TaxID=285279 RepID=UPI000D68ED38|nr:periplasmic nitrate reductase, NapE protein [Pseudovibrio ascidiaceicola]
MAGLSQNTQTTTPAVSKGRERAAFLFLAVVLAPVLMTAAVGGYGFLIWMSQILFGPPSF